MTMKIDRFSVTDIDKSKSNRVGIKDHQDGRVIVVLSLIDNKETTLSIAEKFISVIEEELENGS